MSEYIYPLIGVAIVLFLVFCHTTTGHDHVIRDDD